LFVRFQTTGDDPYTAETPEGEAELFVNDPMDATGAENGTIAPFTSLKIAFVGNRVFVQYRYKSPALVYAAEPMAPFVADDETLPS
jgi:hypothetical protein